MGTATAQRSRLESVQALGLASFQRGALTVYFSRDRESRAEGVATLLADVATFYGVARGQGADTNVAVLDESDWEATFDLPYGLSAYRGDGAIVFLPADLEAGAIFRVLVDGLEASAPEVSSQVRAECGSLRGGARELADLVAVHELGHAYQRRHFGIGPPSQWFNELVAWYVAYEYLAARAPESLRKVVIVNRALAKSMRPTTPSLDEFERSVPTGREYARFQALFVARCHDVHRARGARFLGELAREFPRVATRDQERLENAEILRRLERLSLGFEEWARRVGDLPGGE
jgi:hypothetical protein